MDKPRAHGILHIYRSGPPEVERPVWYRIVWATPHRPAIMYGDNAHPEESAELDWALYDDDACSRGVLDEEFSTAELEKIEETIWEAEMWRIYPEDREPPELD